jgi:hypothetical protein
MDGAHAAYHRDVAIAELGEGLLVRLLGGLVDAVPAAVGAGLLVHGPQGTRQVAAVGAAEVWDGAQVSCRCGPVLEAAVADRVLVIDPFVLTRHPDLARSMPQVPSPTPAALVVVPGSWADDARLVTTLYLSNSPPPDDLDTLSRYEPLLAYALGLLDYCGQAESQAEQMLHMVQYRRVIEQAKGMVMTRRSVGADEAFALLIEHSQRTNTKLRLLAAALVETVGGGPVEHPTDPREHVSVSADARAAAKTLWDAISDHRTR